MNTFKHKLMNAMIGVLAICLLAGMPSASQAGGINFTNHLENTPIRVQTSTFVNGVLVRGPSMVIFPGKSAYDGNMFQGVWNVTIYDANKPNVTLLKKTINFAGFDVQYLVRPSLNPTNPFPVDLFPPPKN